MNTHDIHFKEEISWLFFQLTRKIDSQCIQDMQLRFKNCLTLLKKYIHKDGFDRWGKYLKWLYRMIGFTRDSYKGLGEQALSYMLICSLYDYFPTLAIYALHCFVKPYSTIGKSYYYGCWRDLKYICQYACENSLLKHRHGIIQHCIQIMNHQLYLDIETWKFSANCHSVFHISNVAKHIPHEKSKFSWLFEEMAIQWIHTHKPYILKTADNDISYKLAISKSKRIYRKVLSDMNRALNTTEVTICNATDQYERSHKIDENRPSLFTAMNKKYFFLNSNPEIQDTDIPNKYKNDIIVGFDYKSHSKYFIHGTSSSKISIYNIIKYAIEISKNIQEPSYADDVKFINSLWKNLYLDKIRNCNQTCLLPIIDVSSKMDDEALFTAFGMGILISHISSIKYRILTIDRRPTWININPHHNIVEQISHINDTIFNMQNTLPSFPNVFHLIMHTMVEMNASYDFIQNMKLVILSDMQCASLNEVVIQNQFQMNGIDVTPMMAYWNLSKNKTIELPCHVNSQKSMLFSGYSICHIHHLCSKYKHKNMFDMIVKILDNKRYDYLSNYIDKLVLLYLRN